MIHSTWQIRNWTGDFGKDYTKRNIRTIYQRDEKYKQLLGVTRSDLNLDFMKEIDRSISILEIGSNAGDQLLLLKRIGFENLTGIEIQEKAIQIGKKRAHDIRFIKGVAQDLPFKSNSFVMIFTSVFLIHIPPSEIEKVLTEVYRCSRKYIWGYEYFSSTYTGVPYRGKKDLLWKTDFCQLYMDMFKDLKLVKIRKLKYIANDNVDSIFLLEKTS